MPTTTAVVPNEPAKNPQGVQEKEIAVLAKCVIRIGYVCTVYYPIHYDADSERQHRLYHNENAKVVSIRQEGSLDLEMTTGPAKGKIIEYVDPTNLFFWGSFISSTGVG